MTAFKIVSQSEWDQAVKDGSTPGFGIDLEDGFIHLSYQPQVQGTLDRFFQGREDLLLVAVDLSVFQPDTELKIEENSHGTFPHIYNAHLKPSACLWAKKIPLVDGQHVPPFE